MSTKIRPMAIADQSWVLPQLYDGVRAGHFGPTVYQQAAQSFGIFVSPDGFQMQIIRHERISIRQVLPISYVVEADGAPAAFLIALNFQDGTFELHLAGTVKTQRQRGLFRSLCAHAISRFPNCEDRRIFARCYPGSTWAIAAFKAMGFAETVSPTAGKCGEYDLPEREALLLGK